MTVANTTDSGPVRVTLGAVTTTVAAVLPVFLVGGLAVQVREELRFGPAGLGLAVSVYFGVSALASVPAGALVERFGAATLARAAIVLSGLSVLGIGVLADSLAALVLLLAFGAAANACGQLASNASLAHHVPARRRGVTFGLKQSAIPLSTLLAGAAVPTVALTLGWRWAFVLAAVVVVAALPLVPRDAIRPRRTRGANADRATGALVVIGVAATLGSAAVGALGTFLVDSAVARGLAPGTAGLALTGGSVVCVLARVLGGWQADRFPDRQVGVIAAGLAAGAGGLALLAVPGTVPLSVGVAVGFGFGWSWPGLMNFAVVRMHAHAPAAATSITQTGVYAGGCVGPLALGALATSAGYPLMWTVAAGAMLAAAAFMLLGSSLLHRHAGAAAGPAAART